jgi:hypothetical protein
VPSSAPATIPDLTQPIATAQRSAVGERVTPAAISDVAQGNVSLQQVYPNSGLARLDALAVENTSSNHYWDFIIARGICVDRT